MTAKQGRRDFVKAAAAAIATPAFPILGANDRINVGVVGLGGRGRDHINYYSKLPSDCRLAVVCDVNQSARERAVAQVRKLNNYDPKEITDMRAVFESKDVDAVSLPLPNHWHALATIWACQAGKDVYVEKPATHNIFEAHQVVAAARIAEPLDHTQDARDAVAARGRNWAGLSCSRSVLPAAIRHRPHTGRGGAARTRLGQVSRARPMEAVQREQIRV
jgi:hypothetical protein